MSNSNVQKIAKDTMNFAKNNIHSGMSLLEVRELCERKLIELGADKFWYWNVGALVFSGDETAISISGKGYHTSDRLIVEDDIITIDLSPQYKEIWGDYARTIIVQNGNVVDTDSIKNTEWKNGILTEKLLHQKMCEFVTPQTTFEELYFHIN